MHPLTKVLAYIAIICSPLLLLAQSKDSAKNNSTPIAIQWVDSLPGDYSFKDQWSYPEGIEKNDIGQLICDGLCPKESDHMLDNKRHIIPSKKKAYYKIIDTTHQYHSLKANMQCYECGETDYIEAWVTGTDTVDCNTPFNAGTHSSLLLSICKDTCYARIFLLSVAAQAARQGTNMGTFYCKSGYIKIDKHLYHRGILKAEFHLDFYNYLSRPEPMYWEGKIYKKVMPKAISK